MPTPSLSGRLLDAGVSIRTARPSWARPRGGGPAANRRLALLVAVGVLGTIAIVYLALRLTPLSTVQRVTVVGAQGPDAAKIRRQIEQAALGQSTLGFGDGAVHRAVAGTTSITGLTIHTKFPHAVQVEVHQRLAVGAVDDGGKRVAVATDGTLLPDWQVGKLPLIRGGRTADGKVVGGALLAATVLSKAPPELLAHVARVDDGTVVRVANGPALLFRDTNRVAAKWAAAVAVLSDRGTAGATWIDLRIPDQPVAGKGAPPTLPSKSAKAGKVTASTDALATAEDRPADPTTAPGDATSGDGQGAADATSSAASATPSAASATTSGTAAGTGAGTTSTGTTTAGDGSSGTTSGGTGTTSGASSGTGSATNSGAGGTGAATTGTSGAIGTSGGATAGAGQTTP
jgi:cell division septal protein FtsQ